MDDSNEVIVIDNSEKAKNNFLTNLKLRNKMESIEDEKNLTARRKSVIEKFYPRSKDANSTKLDLKRRKSVGATGALGNGNNGLRRPSITENFNFFSSLNKNNSTSKDSRKSSSFSDVDDSFTEKAKINVSEAKKQPTVRDFKIQQEGQSTYGINTLFRNEKFNSSTNFRPSYDIFAIQLRRPIITSGSRNFSLPRVKIEVESSNYTFLSLETGKMKNMQDSSSSSVSPTLMLESQTSPTDSKNQHDWKIQIPQFLITGDICRDSTSSTKSVIMRTDSDLECAAALVDAESISLDDEIDNFSFLNIGKI
ncbi:hypothetical protein HK096_005129 [Nowakowskiella sp. JEL0078]|nr:hypothetical protein HK096_005129 [Nowakowskiella sp. JEL0078]